MTMEATMYEGVTLDCGLKVKNGELITEANLDEVKQQIAETIRKVNAGPQPARIAREKAAEAVRMKRRR